MTGSHSRRVALALAGLLGACSIADAARPPATPAQARPIPAASLAPFAARVEAARGVRFAAPVAAFELAEEDLPRALAAELDRFASRREQAQESRMLAQLGLAPAGVDLRDAVLRIASASVAGFYSPRDRAFYAVAGAESAGARGAASLHVHELTHALQDQRSELLATLFAIRGDDDLAFALTALLEGEATLVELLDAAAHGGPAPPRPADFAARFAADTVPLDGFPRLLADSSSAPYPLGYALVDALVARGGLAALDAAYADPPLSSSELLHAERYLGGAARAPLAQLPRAPRPPGCRAVATNSYGELGLRVWLVERGVGAQVAELAAASWDGDRAWLLRCRRGEAAAWLLQLADETHAQRVEALARARLADLPALQVERSAHRVLLASGLDGEQRGRLLALPEAPRAASLAAILGARPELRASIARLRR